MAKKETVQQKKIQSLLADLSNSDEKGQAKAIKSLKVHGNETVIEPLLLVLINNPSDQVYAEIVDLLNTPKSTKVPVEIAKALTDKRFIEIRQVLLSSIWNSGLDYSQYLTEIMTAGTQGEMMDALECITILENMEEDLTEDEIFEPLLVLTQYIGSHQTESGPKMDIIREITASLQNRNNLL